MRASLVVQRVLAREFPVEEMKVVIANLADREVLLLIHNERMRRIQQPKTTGQPGPTEEHVQREEAERPTEAIRIARQPDMETRQEELRVRDSIAPLIEMVDVLVALSNVSTNDEQRRSKRNPPARFRYHHRLW